MELQIRPYHKNMFAFGGILVQNPDVTEWLKALQHAGLSPASANIYPIPDTQANTLWGCLIIGPGITRDQVGRHQLCQAVNKHLFIAEHSVIYPAVSAAELDKLLGNGTYVFHPDFGMVELQEAFAPEKYIALPQMRSYHITCPADPIHIPAAIKSFLIQPQSPEEMLNELEEKIFPQHEAMKDKPLTIAEKIKLFLYRTVFSRKKIGKDGYEQYVTEKSGWWQRIEQLAAKALNKDIGSGMQEDFESLEDRNQAEVDKLLDMLAKNPEEALKYAIPLNETGGARGGQSYSFSLSKRWYDLLWSSPNTTSGGGSGIIDLGDRYHDLQRQYVATAEALIKKGKYHDAAFVYMKLLKNPLKAAETLEEGKFYGDAVTIYLKHLGNKKKAAECYEKGNMTLKAIELYKELNEDEKTGDLYCVLAMKNEARLYYDKAAGKYLETHQYIKAATILHKKANDVPAAKEILLTGWTNGRDGANCLHYYFATIDDTEDIKTEVERLYSTSVFSKNRMAFLGVVQQLHSKHAGIREPLREMGYEIVAAGLANNESIEAELRAFNPADKELLKDTMRYKNNKK